MSATKRRIKFEDAIKRLDDIVQAMENGEIGLEESVAKYEEAMEYIARCRTILTQAEQRIQEIQLDAQGRPSLSPVTDADSQPEPDSDAR